MPTSEIDEGKHLAIGGKTFPFCLLSLTVWSLPADASFLCQKANLFIFKLQAMSCELGPCGDPEAYGTTIASLLKVILTNIGGSLRLGPCDVSQIDDASNGQSADAAVSATHSTQPGLPSSTQS